MTDDTISPDDTVTDDRGRTGTVIAVREYANSATVDFGLWRHSVVRLDTLTRTPTR